MADDPQPRSPSFATRVQGLTYPPSTLDQTPSLKEAFDQRDQQPQKQLHQPQIPGPPSLTLPDPRPQPPALGKMQDKKDSEVEMADFKDQANERNEKIRKLNEQLQNENKSDELKKEKEPEPEHDQ